MNNCPSQKIVTPFKESLAKPDVKRSHEGFKEKTFVHPAYQVHQTNSPTVLQTARNPGHSQVQISACLILVALKKFVSAHLHFTKKAAIILHKGGVFAGMKKYILFFSISHNRQV